MTARDAAPTIVLCKWQPELLTELLDLGAEVHLVLDRYDRLLEAGGAALHARCRSVHQVSSFDSVEELAEVAVDLRLRGVEVDRVLSHSELSQFGAGYLELLLGGATDPLAHVSHRDKRLMKQRVRAAGVATARFASVPDPDDPAAATAVARELRMPVVVKPAAGYGAVSTVRVDDAATLATTLAGFTFDPLLRGRQLIVEEFVTGVELAIDATWVDGEALTFVAYRYRDARMTMTEGSRLDGSWVLRPAEHGDLHARLMEVNRRVNRALGVRASGPTHMEVFVRPDGEIVFSEIASRIAGGWAPPMLSAFLGQSVWRLHARVAMGQRPAPPRPSGRYVGAIHLRPTAPGVITRAPSDEELAAQPGVVGWQRIRGVGDRARLRHPSEFYLHVVLEADSHEEFEALAARAAADLAMQTADDGGPSTSRLEGARRSGR